ncbi:uncharacterized protein TrAtP1_011795 [Trichoderma atroviride]|uniref:uncharacterized protein n=1 Tax=Hypocrea atroviridis TaxID=63577 RepID=UPI00332E6C45|nr:hypothetical protein TrAtP1_011795 [Trichoderma atroviride]
MIFQLYESSPGLLAVGVVLSLATVAVFTIRLWGEFVGNAILNTFNGGVLSTGRAAPGPKWQWPNGQFADKFLNGAARSEEWRKYGPVYRVWAGPKPEIVLTTPEDLKVFHTDSDKHTKPLDGNFGWFFDKVLGRCVGLLSLDEWKNMRRVVDPSFTHGASVKRISVTESDARAFVENLHTISNEGAEIAKTKGRFTVPAMAAFMKFPFIFTAEVVYGNMTEAEKEELWEIAEKRQALLPFFFKGSFYRTSYLKWFDRPAYNQLQEFLDSWAEFNTRMARSRREQGLPLPIVTYWDEYLQGNITLEQVTHTLDEMLFANLDVTTHVLTWAITLIADHENAKKELREEIEAHKDNLQEYITNVNTHLHRCYYESLRLRPIAVFSIGESAPSVKNFRGIHVKPNTMVLVDTYAINVRNPFWGPNSEEYDPNRFRNLKSTDLRYNLFVFGFGYRKCLGQYLAGHMVKAILVHLFSQYEAKIIDGRKGKADYDIDKTTWVPVADVTVELTKL